MRMFCSGGQTQPFVASFSTGLLQALGTCRLSPLFMYVRWSIKLQF